MAKLAQQGRALAKEIEEFLNGDNSHMSDEEYGKTQEMLFTKQQHAIEALATALGMGKEQPTTLMQSEDADVENIKRLAGIVAERRDEQSHNYKTMRNIVSQAQHYMMNDKTSATEVAKHIMMLAARIEDE